MGFAAATGNWYSSPLEPPFLCDSSPSSLQTTRNHFWRFLVQEQEIELSIGDSLQIGQHTVTVVDIDGGDVSFRIDHEEDEQPVSVEGFGEFAAR